ncbi:TPA: hypothetical protein OTT42_001933 [Corynebacterium striatum]|nr:hypothetical protein [Corynebacterium striatum]
MAVNINNAFVGAPPIDGGVYFNAPLGTKLPTSATEDLDPAFKDHGAVGEDGFNVNPSRESSTEKMFGGEDWVDLQTGYTETVTLTLLEEDNEAVIKSLFGDANVKQTAATSSDGKKTTIFHTASRLPILSHVLKAVYGEKAKTYVIERGRITTVEKTADVHSASTKYNVTITAFKGTNKDTNFAYVTEYRDDGTPADAANKETAAVSKTVALPSGVAGGTFTLTVDGHKTSALAYNATAAAVQSAVRAAGAAGVTVTGNAGGPYTVKGASVVTADGGSLTGGESTTITVK